MTRVSNSTKGKPTGKPVKKPAKPKAKPVKKPKVKPGKPKASPKGDITTRDTLRASLFVMDPLKTSTPRVDALRTDIARYVRGGNSAQQIVLIFCDDSGISGMNKQQYDRHQERKALIWDLAISLGAEPYKAKVRK